MDAEEQMQAIVEAAGECWHVPGGKGTRINRGMLQKICKCGASSFWERIGGHGRPAPIFRFPNISPHNLNELFRLAEKLGFAEVHIDLHGMADILQWNTDFPDLRYEGRGASPAEALREALHQSVILSPAITKDRILEYKGKTRHLVRSVSADK